MKQTITKTKKVFFDEVMSGQTFFTYNKSNDEIKREFVKTGDNTVKAIDYPMSSFINIEIEENAMVMVSVH
jgi:hypothetical protein